MLIGLGEDKTPFNFGLTRSKVKVTRVTFVEKVYSHYLENYLSQSSHMSHANWSWLGYDLY